MPSGKQNLALTREQLQTEHSLCQQWVINLRSWPVRQIEDGTSLSDQQHATLYELTAAIYRAAGRLGTSCNADDRFTPPGRLEARQDQLPAREFAGKMTGLHAVAGSSCLFPNPAVS